MIYFIDKNLTKTNWNQIFETDWNQILYVHAIINLIAFYNSQMMIRNCVSSVLASVIYCQPIHFKLIVLL